MVVMAGGPLNSRGSSTLLESLHCFLITSDGYVTYWTQRDREADLIRITLGSIRHVSRPCISINGNCGIEIARKGIESDNHP